MSLDTLKPCPFCGGEASVMERTCNPSDAYNPADRAFPVVRCTVCFAQACGKDWQHASTAIEAWNTRALLFATEAPGETDPAGMFSPNESWTACKNCGQSPAAHWSAKSDEVCKAPGVCPTAEAEAWVKGEGEA